MVHCAIEIGKQTRRFNAEISTQCAPGKLGWIAHGDAFDEFAIDDDAVFLGFDCAIVPAMRRIVLQKIGEIVRRNEIVDTDELDIGILDARAENQAADPSKPLMATLRAMSQTPVH